MREFKIPESTIKRRMKFTLIVASTIILIFIGIASLDQLQSGTDIQAILIIMGSTLIISFIAVFFGLRMGESKLRNTRLILEKDSLIWIGPNSVYLQVAYSDIKQIKLNRSKGIILNLKKSFKKIYIPKYIEDIDNVFLVLEKEINRYED